jgi:hypothetical protein
VPIMWLMCVEISMIGEYRIRIIVVVVGVVVA